MLVHSLQRRIVFLAHNSIVENRCDCEERGFVMVQDAKSETLVLLLDASDEVGIDWRPGGGRGEALVTVARNEIAAR
jgi:hypothetical protein